MAEDIFGFFNKFDKSRINVIAFDSAQNQVDNTNSFLFKKNIV